MRIITVGGIPHKFKPHRVQCKECSTVFEFMESEAEFQNNPMTHGEHWRVECPVCKCIVIAVKVEKKSVWDSDITDKQIVDRENR